MKVPCFAKESLSEFVKSAKKIGTQKAGEGSNWTVYGTEVDAPERCLQEYCGSPYRLRRNGSYARQVIEGVMQLMVLIYRFRCRTCGKTVSRPYSFLVPYRRFTAKLISLGVETYGTEATSYKKESDDLAVFHDTREDDTDEEDVPQLENTSISREGCHPAKSTVFSWVDFVCKRIGRILQQVEKELVLRGHDLQQLPPESSFVNKNALKAGDRKYPRQARKPDQLNMLTCGTITAKALLERTNGTVEGLRAYFLSSAERCWDLLSDVSMVLPITQTTELRLW